VKARSRINEHESQDGAEQIAAGDVRRRTRLNNGVMRLLCYILVLTLLVVPATAQKKRATSDDIFAAIPVQLRSELIERLNLLVTYQAKRQWDKVYDLLGERYRGEETKEKFISQQKLASRLSRFTPDATQDAYRSETDGEWTIWGCGEYGNRPRDKHLSAVQAYRQNGDWYFSTINIVFKCVDCDPAPCH
jgi:hypothetical protein